MSSTITSKAIDDAYKGVNKAKNIGVSATMFYKWRSGDKPNPLDKTLKLIKHAPDNGPIINLLCEMAGGYFVPNESGKKTRDLNLTVAKTIGSMSGVCEEMAKAAEDGRVTDRELDEIVVKFREFMKDVEGFRGNAEAKVWDR